MSKSRRRRATPPAGVGSEAPLALPTAPHEAGTEADFLVAVHVAAHAVASAACGADYRSLRMPADPSAPCDFSPTLGTSGGGPARNATEAAIISSLAGSEAEALAAGESRRQCSDVTRWLTDGDPHEAEPYIEWLRLKAARAVEHPLRQRLILALATALIERGALTGAEVLVLAETEIGRYMRGQ